MASNIFHQGDLQSGISLAIQEQKVVACLVRKDDDHASQIWEDYWLANNSHPTDMLGDDEPPLGLVVGEKAVLLKIEEGSQEAGFLYAFCSIEKVPTLVVIHNGKVLEKLEGGIEKEEFSQRLLKAVGFGNHEDEDEEDLVLDEVDPGQPAYGNQDADAAPSVQDTSTTQPLLSDTGQSQTANTTSQPASNAQTLLQERAQRLEADHQKREAAEKAERIARANSRRKEAEEANKPKDKGKQRATTVEQEKQRSRDAWIYQQKQRKDEAKKERERILGQIESDKQERKAQAQRQKEYQASGGAGAYSEISASLQNPAAAPISRSSSCALQVRLFDGSSMRGKFAPDTDIATAVRIWVSEAAPSGSAKPPFTFRHINPPQPARTIEVSEEHQTLQDLGLCPTATLVLVPVAGYTDAYSGAQGGYWGKMVGSAYWLYDTSYSFLGSAISYVPVVNRMYMGGTGDVQEESNVEGAQRAGADSFGPGRAGGTVGGSSGMKVKTLADQRAQADKAKDPVTFYNGNSSAFEGRKDDDEK